MWSRAMNIFTNCERTDEQTNSISDYSADPMVVQFHYSLITFRILPAFRDSVAGMNVSFICVTRLSQLPDHAKVSDPAEDYILSLHQHFLIHPTTCVSRFRMKEIFAKTTLAASVTNTLFELCSDVIKGWQNLLQGVHAGDGPPYNTLVKAIQ